MNRNNRLKKLVDLNAPEVIIRNEKRMLQAAVDALFDNARCRRPVLGSSNRPLKSLTDMIKGKQGRFRENLLGKRVDYSARSVIVIGPELKLHQAGLPKTIALELFQPFIIRRLKELGYADTIKSAKRMIERRDREVWDILEEVTHQHPVLLNRAPTLHRMGIQAFEPVLIEGNAIKIHPLVCRGFNADFDGDQMAVHLPLSLEAQVDATVLMMSTNNIFSPSNGRPIMSPSQDIVLGCFYLTTMRPGMKGAGKAFKDFHEAIAAHAHGKIDLHAPIKVRLPEGMKVAKLGGLEKEPESPRIETTVGRIFFNDVLPKGMPFYNFEMAQKGTAQVISDCYRLLGRARTIHVLDAIKELGFRWSTLAGLSFSTEDLRVPVEKKRKILDATQKDVDKINRAYEQGAITDGERYNQVIDAWTHARELVTQEMMKELEEDTRGGVPYLNPIFLMTHSGARGSIDQVRQLAGMRGLMAKPSGLIIETPIKANFREGLTVLEYFSSTHGARKGLADTALKTADSGYLTRKLADVAQNVIVSQTDCGTLNSIEKEVWYKGAEVDRPLSDAIVGRVAAQSIVDPLTDEYVVKENEIITNAAATRIEQLGIDHLRVRSPLVCESSKGVCARCYGVDLSTGKLVEEGMAVGIIAAESIGEPGTQLTMRTFHIGGTASRAVLASEHRATQDGTVKFQNIRAVPVDDGGAKRIVSLKHNGEIMVLDSKGRELERFTVPLGAALIKDDGKNVKAGDVLCKWDPYMAPILAEEKGIVRYADLVEGETMRVEEERTGHKRRLVIEHKGELHPRVIVEEDAASGGSSKGDFKSDLEQLESRLMLDFPDKAGGRLLPRYNDQNRLGVRGGGDPSTSKAAKAKWQGDLEMHLPRIIAMLQSSDTEWWSDPEDSSFKSAVDAKATGLYFFRSRKAKDVGEGYIGLADRTGIPKEIRDKVAGDNVSSNIVRRVAEELFQRRIGSDLCEVNKKEKDQAADYIKSNLEFTFYVIPKETQMGPGGKILEFHYIPARTYVEVEEGEKVVPGTLLARRPREMGGTQDITGGLPRVTELFEARKPKEPAVMSEIDGVVELSQEKKRGKMTIIVRNPEAEVAKEHYVPHDRHLRVHTGDQVRAGDQLTDGPLVPHDILRIVGEAELQKYMLHEIQNVYRSQKQSIDDKHPEIILGQMLRKVRVDRPGDTNFLPGEVVDKFRFRRENERLNQMVKIADPGDTEFEEGQLVLRSECEEAAAIAEQGGGQPPKRKRPRQATAKTMLLGITKASLQSESFLSAASFQETTKVLTEASLAGKMDPLVGLKENVVLGHLVPAGTGFKAYLESAVKLHAEPVTAPPEAAAVVAAGAEAEVHRPAEEETDI
jgi:DNA-directed RNA polymerase beta' subunit